MNEPESKTPDKALESTEEGHKIRSELLNQLGIDKQFVLVTNAEMKEIKSALFMSKQHENAAKILADRLNTSEGKLREIENLSKGSVHSCVFMKQILTIIESKNP